jgi:imidazolonepropionase-like amidohydrolase
MLDVTTGRIVTPATVRSNAGVVAAVNPPSVSPGATVIDLGDVTLLPGFIDAHVASADG